LFVFCGSINLNSMLSHFHLTVHLL